MSLNPLISGARFDQRVMRDLSELDPSQSPYQRGTFRPNS